MGATFVMSYPAADWNASAGRNPRNAGPARPRAALTEWVALADAILYAGGRILVCDPPALTATAPLPPTTSAATATSPIASASPTGPSSAAGTLGLPYTADWGALIRRNDQGLFLLPRAPEGRAAETEIVRAFFAAAGVQVQALPCATSGRGDLVQVGPGRYVFLAGAYTDPGAGTIVAKELGATVRYVEGRVAPPFAYADEVLATLVNPAGDVVMLAHEPGMRDRSIPDLRSTFQKVDVISVDADDAAAGACTSLCVNGTVIHPAGLSTAVRSHLIRRGFQLVELDFPELRGRGGGGAHALVNELVGFVMGLGAPDYPHARERIVALIDTYPETSA